MFTPPGADARAKRNARVLGAPGTSNRHRRGCEHCGAIYQPIPGAVQGEPELERKLGAILRCPREPSTALRH